MEKENKMVYILAVARVFSFQIQFLLAFIPRNYMKAGPYTSK